jgi:hypothetical protein
VKYHFNCFEPRTKDPIQIFDHYEKSLVKRLETWNKQFEPPNLSLLIKPSSCFQSSTRYFRAWIQIFKFFPVEEAIKFGAISKELYMASRSVEVISEVSGISGIFFEEVLKKYLINKLRKCVECGSDNYLVFCVVLKRSFCCTCFKRRYLYRGIHKKFSLRIVGELMKEYNVGWDFLEKVRMCQDSQFYYRTYPFLVEKMLQNYQEGTAKQLGVGRNTRKKAKINED